MYAFCSLSPNKGVTVCVKYCLICKTPVRFQEYTAEFHNFNNIIILNTRLCAMMTSALKVRKNTFNCYVQHLIDFALK